MATKEISLKLKKITSADAVLARFSKVAGIVKIERLFPEFTDPDLATYYMVEVESLGASFIYIEQIVRGSGCGICSHPAASKTSEEG